MSEYIKCILAAKWVLECFGTSTGYDILTSLFNEYLRRACLSCTCKQFKSMMGHVILSEKADIYISGMTWYFKGLWKKRIEKNNLFQCKTKFMFPLFIVYIFKECCEECFSNIQLTYNQQDFICHEHVHYSKIVLTGWILTKV